MAHIDVMFSDAPPTESKPNKRKYKPFRFATTSLVKMQWWTVIAALALFFNSVKAEENKADFAERLTKLSPDERKAFINEMYRKFKERVKAQNLEKMEKLTPAEQMEFMYETFEELLEEAAEKAVEKDPSDQYEYEQYDEEGPKLMEILSGLHPVKAFINFLTWLIG
ncbi:unnamed protein product [Heligmosomoides polygyrus]|uniref:DUF148 domain-containing protein n=1 Tax=Heligmosomoides polygyrus TaxID=6339 RepID=A0A183FT63_HELPZ|nr:unnamed protein product [Heligmosomoides polygyrus]